MDKNLKIAIQGIRWAVLSVFITIIVAIISLALELINLEEFRGVLTLITIAVYFYLAYKLYNIMKEIDKKHLKKK